MSQEYFVIGDIHGQYTLLKELLEHWDGISKLVFLGDLIDRGEDSLAVVTLVKDLVEKKGAICLFGNHERMFLDWIYDPIRRYEHYQRNGGDTTINAFLKRPLATPVDGVADAGRLQVECGDLVDFIRTQLVFHHETPDYIFVHAGLDLTLSDWHYTSQYQKVWIRTPFHQAKNQTGKTIVFGHTPVYDLLGEELGTTKLWQTADGKIGMDGGAVYGGVLHGIVFSPQGIKKHIILGSQKDNSV